MVGLGHIQRHTPTSLTCRARKTSPTSSRAGSGSTIAGTALGHTSILSCTRGYPWFDGQGQFDRPALDGRILPFHNGPNWERNATMVYIHCKRAKHWRISRIIPFWVILETSHVQVETLLMKKEINKTRPWVYSTRHIYCYYFFLYLSVILYIYWNLKLLARQNFF